MGEAAALLLAAEIDGERARIARTIGDVRAASAVLDDHPEDRLSVYGAAALLDAFYTGVEKALGRVARHFDLMPAGAGWHRELLDSATVDVPGVRPPVLSVGSVRALDPFLAFRHRVRNLYPFELEGDRVRLLLADAPTAWEPVDSEFARFAETLRALTRVTTPSGG